MKFLNVEKVEVSAYGRLLLFLFLKNQTQADTDIFSVPIKIYTGETPLNKPELIQTLKERCYLTNEEAKEIVKIFFYEMTNAMIAGDRVEIRGFCSFFLKEYKGYTGRNPKTGKKAQVPPKRLPFFKCGKELKERVDYSAN